ncbi:MAG: PQQ-binding-like beta-propeller repeat protein [Myxococcota bacterium]
MEHRTRSFFVLLPWVVVSCAGNMEPDDGVVGRAEVISELRLARQSGPPTTVVTATGRADAGSPIQITANDQLLAETTANELGEFSVEFVVPEQAPPGPLTIRAMDQEGAIATASFLVRTGWPQVGFDAAHTNNNRYERLIGRGNVSQLHERWQSAKARSAFGTTMAIGTGHVYAVALDGELHAFKTETGTRRWRIDLGASAPARLTPAAVNGSVFVTHFAGTFLALDPQFGTVKWRVDGVPPGNIIVSSGTAFVYGSQLFAISAEGCSAAICQPSWVSPILRGTPLTAVPETAPVVGRGVVVTPPLSGARPSVYAFSVSSCSGGSCSPLWNWGVDEGSLSPPAYYGGEGADKFIIGSAFGLRGLQPLNGSEIATGLGDERVSWSALAITDTKVFQVSDALYAFDLATLNRLWKADIGQDEFARSAAPPVVANGVIYAAGKDRVVAFDADCAAAICEPLWQVNVPGPAGIAVADGRVYVSSTDRSVHCYGLP